MELVWYPLLSSILCPLMGRYLMGMGRLLHRTWLRLRLRVALHLGERILQIGGRHLRLLRDMHHR